MVISSISVGVIVVKSLIVVYPAYVNPFLPALFASQPKTTSVRCLKASVVVARVAGIGWA